MENPKSKNKNEQEDAQWTLQVALGFDDEDIEANRDGRLSNRQRARLADHEFRWIGIAILASLVIVWSILNASGRIDVAIGQGGIPWLIAAAITGYAWYKGKQYYDYLHAQEIGAVQGRVQLNMQSSKNSTALTVGIQDLQFSVKQQAFLAFKNGDPYAIYYAPRSKTILSAEWLRET
jgi:hypothetical protein